MPGKVAKGQDSKRMGITISQATFERLVVEAARIGVTPSTFVSMLVSQSLNQQRQMDTMNRFFDLLDRLPAGALQSGKFPEDFQENVKQLQSSFDEN